MKIFRRTAGDTRIDHKRNEEILEELEVEPVKENLRRYKSNWLRHVPRMNSNMMTKIMLNCRRNGRRQLGRPLKRLSDEAERGLSRSNLWTMMTMMIVILETKKILPTLR
jgi:hypothetical protein